MGYTIIILLLTESFPTEVQSVCAGVVEGIAQCGSFIAPIIITMCINIQVYSMIVLSGILVVIVVLPLFVFEENKRMGEGSVLRSALGNHL
jgi:hypothetical protein